VRAETSRRVRTSAARNTPALRLGARCLRLKPKGDLVEKSLFTNSIAGWRAAAAGALALLAACSSSGTTSSSTTTGGAASTTGGVPDYVDAGTCINNACQSDSDCCSGFACNTVDTIDTCCEIPNQSNPLITCQQDSDCCADPDGGDQIPYCDAETQFCTTAPSCVPLGNPCAADGGGCCSQAGVTVICDPVNELCVTCSTPGFSCLIDANCCPVTGNSVSCVQEGDGGGECILGAGSSTTGGSTSSGGATGGSTSSGSGSGSGTGGTGGSSGGSTGGIQTGVDFAWNFGVTETCEQAGVSWIEIQLSGNTVGLFPCRDPYGNEGATVSAAAFSQINYTLTAFDPSGAVTLAQANGFVSTEADITDQPVTLTFGSGGPSSLNLLWTFAGQTCAQAGVTNVQVEVQDPNDPSLGVNQSMACSGSIEGAVLPGYAAGQYPVTLSATGTSASYQAMGSIFANGLSNVVMMVDLLPTSTVSTGSVLVNFDFGGLSCAASGLDNVGLQLAAANGNPLVPGTIVPCADAGTSYLFTSVPAPATAFLWIEGISLGQSEQLANPQVIVSPGGTATYSAVTQLGN
jgi:hypothetical protein